MPVHIEIQRIADAALFAVDSLLPEWLPDGARKGKEFWPTNPVRGDRKPGSFSINMATGTWHDFASGDKGGDLVSLLAYLRGCRQIDAARAIAGQLGIEFGGNRHKRNMLEEALERQRRAHQRDQRQQQAAAELQAGYARTAERARRDLAQGRPADPAFDYLKRKGIGPHHLRQGHDPRMGDVLLAPMYHNGKLANLQRIARYSGEGSKRFLPGPLVPGAYCPFGKIETGGELYVVEGVATAIALHEMTGKSVAAAMSLANMLPAGQELRRRYPESVLIFGGDDDRLKEAAGKPNAGKLAAIHAAATLGCGYVLPAFPADAPLALSDFCDLRQWQEGRL